MAKPPPAHAQRFGASSAPLAQAFVTQAQEVETNGGMLIPDGSRKRTLGGIFFCLVRTQVSDAEAVAINVMWRSKQKRKKLARPHDGQTAPTNLTPSPLPPFVWDEAQPIIAELTANIGAASTVKMTVIGSPTQVVERQSVIILALRSTKAPTLPKGLPPLPATPTNYMTNLATSQLTHSCTCPGNTSRQSAAFWHCSFHRLAYSHQRGMRS